MEQNYLISPNEILIDSKISFDAYSSEIAQRIEHLGTYYLSKKVDAGWEILYQDPQDKRLWEKTYYNGKENLMLRCLTPDEANSKYVVETIKADETIIDSDNSYTLGRKNIHRIHRLTANYLEKIIENGGEVLYKDLNDNRFWELTYPTSEMHGGGRPLLINIDKDMVLSKYGVL